MIAILGAVLTLAGSTLLYLASPNQRAAAANLPGKPLALLGSLTLAGGLAAFLAWAGPATAVFIWMTLAMLVWSVVPVTAAWLRRPRAEDAR